MSETVRRDQCMGRLVGYGRNVTFFLNEMKGHCRV